MRSTAGPDWAAEHGWSVSQSMGQVLVEDFGVTAWEPSRTGKRTGEPSADFGFRRTVVRAMHALPEVIQLRYTGLPDPPRTSKDRSRFTCVQCGAAGCGWCTTTSVWHLRC